MSLERICCALSPNEQYALFDWLLGVLSAEHWVGQSELGTTWLAVDVVKPSGQGGNSTTQ
jgi:hypothetical protein